MQTKQIFMIILFILAAIIWGNFIIKMINGLSTDKDVVTNKTLQNKSEFQKIEFKGDFRDPFSEAMLVKTTQSSKSILPENSQTKTVQIKDLPRIELAGIVGDTAILNVNNQTYFVKAGDILDFGKVIALSEDGVEIEISKIKYKYYVKN